MMTGGAVDTDHSFAKGTSMKAITRPVLESDYLEFEDTTGSAYYEKCTDITMTAPNGDEVKLNSLGAPGKPPHMYFAFTQGEDNTIYLYGIGGPGEDGSPVIFQWLPEPIVNYPGEYNVGDSWATIMETPAGIQKLVNKVEETVEIETCLGRQCCRVIRTYDEDGNLDAEAYFSINLGVNVKRISDNPGKPGYELTKYHINGTVSND